MGPRIARLALAAAVLTAVLTSMLGFAPAHAAGSCGPHVSVGNDVVVEGGQLRFAVTLSCGVIGKVYYTTYDTMPGGNNDAKKTFDFAAKSGWLEWTGDDPLTQYVYVTTYVDNTMEAPEELGLRLYNRPGGTPISDSMGLGTINNSTPVCIAGTFCQVGLELAAPAGAPLAGRFHTVDETARADVDFEGVTDGEFAAAAEDTTVDFRVRVLANTPDESEETFAIQLTDVRGGDVPFDRIPILIPAS